MLETNLPVMDDEEGDRVPAGLLPVMDAHVNIFPEGIFSAVRKWFNVHAWHIRYQMSTSELFEFLLSRDNLKKICWGNGVDFFDVEAC